MSKPKEQTDKFGYLLKKYSGWIAALIIVVAFGYYLNNGIFFSSAFEQLSRSLAYYVAEQSGLPNYDGNMNLGVHYAKPGDTVDMWITVKNMSKNPKALTWYPESSILDEGPEFPYAHAIGVGTANPIDNKPHWVESSSFVMNGNRFMYYNGPEVQKNGYVTFVWKVKVSPYAIPGTYTLDLDLVREFDEHGIRVNSSGRMLTNQFVRWNFKISDLNVYDIPINSLASNSPNVIYMERVPGETSTGIVVNNLISATSYTVYTAYDPERVSIADPVNGRFLVYSSNPYTWSAKIMNPDGTLYMDLSSITPGYPITGALVSPDERYIALNTSNFPGEFYVYDTTTQDLTAHTPIFNPWLSNGGNYRYYNYWWSADSSKLYARWSDSSGSDLQINKNSGIDQLPMPPTNTIEPIPVITNLQLKDIVFDLLSNGTAVGSNYSLENDNIVPPSNMKLIYPNTGIVDEITNSEVSVYKVKAMSQDGSIFAYETINDVGNEEYQHLLWVSRTNDIYQPILIGSYPATKGGAVVNLHTAGFSPDNKYFFYVEQIDTPENNLLQGFYDSYFMSAIDLSSNIPVFITPSPSFGPYILPILTPLGIY